MPLLVDFDLACKLQMSHVFCKVSGGFTKISQVKMNSGGGGGVGWWVLRYIQLQVCENGASE